MQYRLSTLFLVIFVYAASLAAFGPWGILVASVFCAAAICLNWAEKKVMGIAFSLTLACFGLCCGGMSMLVPVAREDARSLNCQSWLKMIGLVVLNYEVAHKEFPPVYYRDKQGKKQFSWRVNILPYMEQGHLYDSLNKNEPWDCSSNAAILASHIQEFECPSVERDKNDYSCNYLAIIGPGTIWREDGAKTVADLPQGQSKAIIAVETVDSKKHWAEPYALTVDEVLENMKNKKGVRISTNHPDYVHAVFADCAVRRLPSKMPLSLWRKILNGEIADINNLENQIDPNAEDMIDVSTHSTRYEGLPALLAVIVWLASVIWLFYRAWKSRETVLVPFCTKPLTTES
jgi:hypothetical protein